jgi:hypothetical protein
VLWERALRPGIIDTYDLTRKKTIWVDVLNIGHVPPYLLDTCNGRRRQGNWIKQSSSHYEKEGKKATSNTAACMI